MRHSGQAFRRAAARILRRPVLISALVAAAVLPLSSFPSTAQSIGQPVAQGRSAAAGPEITGMRLGRHSGFLRLVFDLTADPRYEARATGADTFIIDLPGAYLPPEGRAAMATDPLAPDLVVRPEAPSSARPSAGRDGLRFRVTSRGAAFIRRSFVLAPPAGGLAPKGAPWRLVLDIVAKPDGGGSGGSAGPAVLAALPAPHGMEDPETPQAPSAVPAAVSSELPDASPAPAPRQVAVSWARASRILRELQDHRDPAVDQPVPPQLVLPPKYRQPVVPLR